MAQVDHHPQPVHLAHDLASERGQPAVLRLVSGRVGPARRAPVGQRHVPDPARVRIAQDRHRRPDHAAALEPEERRDPAVRERGLHLVGGRGQRERVRVPLDEPVDDVHLLERLVDGLGFGQRGRDPDRPELAADEPRSQSRDVRVEIRLSARRSTVDAASPTLLAQRVGEVVVAIDERRVAQDLARARVELVGRGGHAGHGTGPPSTLARTRPV